MQISDDQWNAVAKNFQGGLKPCKNPREVLNAALTVASWNGEWPAKGLQPSKSTVQKYLHTWSKSGVLTKTISALVRKAPAKERPIISSIVTLIPTGSGKVKRAAPVASPATRKIKEKVQQVKEADTQFQKDFYVRTYEQATETQRKQLADLVQKWRLENKVP